MDQGARPIRILLPDGRLAALSPEQEAALARGERLLPVGAAGEVLIVPKEAEDAARAAVDDAAAAFAALGQISDDAITRFFDLAAAMLSDEAVWAGIEAVNAEDVARAKAAGRATGRLQLTPEARRLMIEGLRAWGAMAPARGAVVETVVQDGFRVEVVKAALGLVAFVFEGRPNVLVDACGVLRGGNAVVFRIGSDARETARAMMRLAIGPALSEAGLPQGAVGLVDSAAHAAGWALFSDRRLSLAVARGSGPSVALLGALASQAGIPVSLHGTGGAWIVAHPDASPEALREAVFASLDRKVCNTLNVLCVPRRSEAMMAAALDGIEAAGARCGGIKVYVTEEVPLAWSRFGARRVAIRRGGNVRDEPMLDCVDRQRLGHEWEWDETPEVTLCPADGVDEAVALFNAYAPRFVASLIGGGAEDHARFWQTVDAPFVGDAHTRWVDGQKALKKPELGLSNWQNGRLFARAGVLTGDGIYTLRLRYVSE
jgi:glutamate-5-semialdehyde dehydrogenase